MNNLLEQYFKIGLVSFMSYPELGNKNLLDKEYYNILSKIARDPFFSLLEVNEIFSDSKIIRTKKIARESGLRLALNAQASILNSGYNPNSLDEANRQKSIDILKRTIDKSEQLGSQIVTFVSGKWHKTTRNEQLEKLVKTTVEVCRYAKRKGIFIQLEIFDHDFDKKSLIGPASLALKYADKVRTYVSNFGLMVDLSHFPQTGETSTYIFSTLKPYITHLHIGNVVMVEGTPAYGDIHPRFGFPNSSNQLSDLVNFFEIVIKSGLLNEDLPINLSFEVKPFANEDPDLIFVNSKRIINRAWSMAKSD